MRLLGGMLGVGNMVHFGSRLKSLGLKVKGLGPRV